MEPELFPKLATVADRQAKTDPLLLERLVTDLSTNKRIDEAKIKAAHEIFVRWADLETSGRLATLNETQLQGDFLAEIFGDALGYTGPTENEDTWYRIQHHSIAGETPDAVLGVFHANVEPQPLAVVELKGPKVHLDRDRSNGRTAVDQCWDYLNNTPAECRWGIVSNMVSFRLYERQSTKRVYEHAALQTLRDYQTFRKFYVVFHRQGLVERWQQDPPRAISLLEQSRSTQREVGDKLYDLYSTNRSELIRHLHFQKKHNLEDAIEMAQRLLDRIIFIAFCEDRRLLPQKTIEQAWSVSGFHAVTNPRWQSFKNLFQLIDRGNGKQDIPRYNGGLFEPHAVDDLQLEDDPWTTFFKNIGGYDFAGEVNLDVLGHLFERSITELEKLKQSAFFGGDEQKAAEFATMPQSAKRKRMGIYYTPPELTGRIVQYTVEELIVERFAEAAGEFGGRKKRRCAASFPKMRTTGESAWRFCAV